MYVVSFFLSFFLLSHFSHYFFFKVIWQLTHGFSITRKPHVLSAVEYCLLQPAMVPAVNRLLSSYFWPGIDVSSYLTHPLHTIVVTYRHFVIGCGFVTTSGYIPYLMVHPEWVGCGFGTFILYYLIQASPGRDITLHISCSSPAMLLFQTFSFKPLKLIKGFYSKYLPETSSSSSTLSSSSSSSALSSSSCSSSTDVTQINGNPSTPRIRPHGSRSWSSPPPLIDLSRDAFLVRFRPTPTTTS